MKDFIKIEKRISKRVEKLNKDISNELIRFLINKECGLRFINGLQFTKDNGEIIFIEGIYTSCFSAWVKYRYNKEIWVKEFNNSFSLNEKIKLFQMLSNI